MKMTVGAIFISVLLSGCGITYRLEDQTYPDAEQFHAAGAALHRESQMKIVSSMRVSKPLSKKTLIIGIPTIDVIKGGFIMPNALQVTPAQLIVRDNLSQLARKEYEMFAETIKECGIYQEVRTIDTTGGHLQPSSTETVLYMYVVPQANAYQWYINGGKAGLQTVNMDRGQPKFLGKATSWVNSVKGYALTD